MQQAIAKNKILVVGGSGFIGQALIRRLIHLDAEVVSLSRTGSRVSQKFDDLITFTADFRDPIALAGIGSFSFDYIFNLGGYIDHSPYTKGGREVIDTHYGGLLNLLSSIDLSRVKKFVQVGSSDEYGNAPAPQREGMREAPISPYSVAKVSATHLIQALCRTEKFPGVVVRLFLVYGPGQSQQRFLPQIITGCLKGERFPTSAGGQVRDFCYIDDVVDGIIHAAIKPRAVSAVINIASGEPITVRAVIEKVVQLIGSGKPDFGALPYRSGENMKLYADISAARELLGWQPATSLDDGLKKTIFWYRQGLKN